MKIEEVKTTELHAIELGQNLRLQDKQEVVAKTGQLNYKQTILDGIKISDYARTVLVNDQVALIYGVVRSIDLEDVGSPYMLCTDQVKKITLPFIRGCKKRVKEMEKKYRILFNYIDGRNKLHLRFIKWCGFEILNEKKFNDVTFYGFYKGEK